MEAWVGRREKRGDPVAPPTQPGAPKVELGGVFQATCVGGAWP